MARTEIEAKTPFGARLREIRRELGDPDRETFAKKLQISKSGLAHYERGERAPDCVVLCAYHTTFGVDINWLLTGRGTMFTQNDTGHSFLGNAIFDEKRFLAAIEAVEEGLKDKHQTLPPDRKAKLYLAVYQLLEKPENKGQLAQLIAAL